MARCSVLFLLAVPAVLGLLLPSCMGDNILYTGESLNARQFLSHLTYSLVMQADCNLVLYDFSRPGQTIWESGTSGRGSGCRVTMQSDGNLVIYGGGGAAVWASNTNRATANYVFILQKDRNLVIYGPAIWATGTNTQGTLGVVVASNTTASAVPDLGNKH